MQANEAVNGDDTKAKAAAERTTKGNAGRRATQKDAGGNGRDNGKQNRNPAPGNSSSCYLFKLVFEVLPGSSFVRVTRGKG